MAGKDPGLGKSAMKLLQSWGWDLVTESGEGYDEVPAGGGGGGGCHLQTPAACVLRVAGPASRGDCDERAWHGHEAPARRSAAPSSLTHSTHSPRRVAGLQPPPCTQLSWEGMVKGGNRVRIAKAVGRCWV